MGGGLLPVSIDTAGQLVFLFGEESNEHKWNF